MADRAAIIVRGAMSTVARLWIAALVVIVLFFCCLLVGHFQPLVVLSENQALYIFSSQAQVIAAVYGLTITGYIFISNQQDKLYERDPSLEGIVERIKNQQYSYISFLTVSSLGCMFFALLAIACRESTSHWLILITQNASGVLFVSALLFAGYFVREAMKPGKIESASDAVKGEAEREAEERPSVVGINASDEEVSIDACLDEVEVVVEPYVGDELEEAHLSGSASISRFLFHYNYIEKMLNEYSEQGMQGPLSQKQESEARKYRFTSGRLISIMEKNGVIDRRLADQLSRLVRYRNALVHGTDLQVSDVFLSRVVKARFALARKLREFYAIGDGNGL